MAERMQLLDALKAWACLAVPAVGVLAFWWAAFRRQLGLFGPQRQRAVPWTGLEIYVVLVACILLWPSVCYTGLSQLGFFKWLYGEGFPTPADTASEAVQQLEAARAGIWTEVFAFPLKVASLLVLLSRISGTRLYQLGLTWSRWGPNLAAGCASWLVLVPVVFAVWIAAQLVLQWWSGEPIPEHKLVLPLTSQPLTAEWLAVGFLVVVAAPAYEELLFRGVLQRWLAQRSWGGSVAVAAAFFVPFLRGGVQENLGAVLFVLCLLPAYFFVEHLTWRWLPVPNAARTIFGVALLFACWHPWPTPIPLFLLALGLGYLAFRTQSLVAPITLHVGFNAVSFLYLVLAKA